MSSREIKFRAWDGNKMIFHEGGKSVGNPHIDFNGRIYSIGESKHWSLMQCSGLKDKNGKEIFESDIVKLYYKGIYRFCEIVFVDGMFCLKWDDGYVNKYQLYPQSLEVVGNIYESKIK